MKVKVSVHRLTDKLAEFVFENSPIVIGRSPDADITLEDRWVSRLHCEIQFADEGLIVRDLGSKHGTLVNDALTEQALLKPGDTVNVGLSTLVAAFDTDVCEPAEVAPSLTS